ncbi:hypothetical protein B7494_g4838 [Chlorociboria aeruginascens]|nr:hypothetical protein B7494_g4838 [Chlorociboria aeruginascens]
MWLIMGLLRRRITTRKAMASSTGSAGPGWLFVALNMDDRPLGRCCIRGILCSAVASGVPQIGVPRYGPSARRPWTMDAKPRPLIFLCLMRLTAHEVDRLLRVTTVRSRRSTLGCLLRSVDYPPCLAMLLVSPKITRAHTKADGEEDVGRRFLERAAPRSCIHHPSGLPSSGPPGLVSFGLLPRAPAETCDSGVDHLRCGELAGAGPWVSFSHGDAI